jgi:hypothetical protein
MVTPRTHCPECNAHAVVELKDVLYHLEADFFWCSSCRAMWHVAKGQSGPASKSLLGAKTPEPAA